ncbi:MAG: hypothetical protein IT184_13370 [Acidobacteria bacterium]|nr:hypothetical protein [Acidobacteriota bacterium]
MGTAIAVISGVSLVLSQPARDVLLGLGHTAALWLAAAYDDDHRSTNGPTCPSILPAPDGHRQRAHRAGIESTFLTE